MTCATQSGRSATVIEATIPYVSILPKGLLLSTHNIQSLSVKINLGFTDVEESKARSDVSLDRHKVFTEVGFPYMERALFADPDLMRQAGAAFYTNAKEQPAVRDMVQSTVHPNSNPPIMFGFKRDDGPKGYIIRNPTEKQIQVFQDADYDFRRGALAADSDLMERAGAERCADMNLVPEFVAIILRGSMKVSNLASIIALPLIVKTDLQAASS